MKKCKFCNVPIKLGKGWKFCTKSCSESFLRRSIVENAIRLRERKIERLKREINDISTWEIKIRKKPAKSEFKKLEAKCDLLWATIVKKWGVCEYCGQPHKMLNAHHVWSRSRKTTRHDPENGIALCPLHHNFSHEFSAHWTPDTFFRWIIDKRGWEWYERTRRKAQKTCQYDLERLKRTHEKLNNLLQSQEL